MRSFTQLLASKRSLVPLIGVGVVAGAAVAISFFQFFSKGTVAPNAPQSVPKASEVVNPNACTLVFDVNPPGVTPTDVPTNTPTITLAATATLTPTSTPSRTPTFSPTATFTPTSTATTTPSSTPTVTPINTSTAIPTRTIAPTNTATPTTTPPGLPKAGNTGPTLTILVIGIGAIMLGLVGMALLL